MSSELVKSSADPLAVIQMAIEKGTDVESMKALFDLKRQYDRDRAAEAFAEAVKRFQSKMPAVEKRQSVPGNDGKTRYTFASHEDIMAIAQPILDACNIAVTFSVDFTDKHMKTTCHVRVGTHVESTTVPLGIPDIPKANDAQKAGAAISYGRRYAMIAALNIRVKGEDRDAQGIDEQLISLDQIETINQLLEDYREARGKAIDLKRFLAFLGVKEGGTVGDILTNRFDEAVATLKAKIAEGRK